MFKIIIPILLKDKFSYNSTLLATDKITHFCNTLLSLIVVKF
jgi:hypothetical protein